MTPDPGRYDCSRSAVVESTITQSRTALPASLTVLPVPARNPAPRTAAGRTAPSSALVPNHPGAHHREPPRGGPLTRTVAEDILDQLDRPVTETPLHRDRPGTATYLTPPSLHGHAVSGNWGAAEEAGTPAGGAVSRHAQRNDSDPRTTTHGCDCRFGDLLAGETRPDGPVTFRVLNRTDMGCASGVTSSRKKNRRIAALPVALRTPKALTCPPVYWSSRAVGGLA